MNILIVDDEAQIRRWFETLLQRTGLDINVAGACGNGKEALEFCREHPVDLVITDIKMPVMDGLQLIRQLVERQPGVRSLILSSYDEFKYASEALKLGASEYILKAEVTVDGLREDEVHSLKSRLNENRYALRAIYFKELLKGQPAAVREFRDKMIWLDVPLSDKHPMLMTLSLDDYPSCLSEAKIRTPELLESAILNILDETVRGETGGRLQLPVRGKSVCRRVQRGRLRRQIDPRQVAALRAPAVQQSAGISARTGVGRH
ncbi:response regulator [Cohnella sp. LGH]|uniref:response regulator n=1 Tax=Cohnella sp. LGH TaxID=1619153 RepID=UPI001ADCA19F|nr:response regulator [Cohnella sp. LGH]QTH41056.1 response regulator [Cohnella sp. LGH]